MPLEKYNYSKLRGRIREIFDTENEFAEQLGISTVSLSSKLNNKTVFKQNEIAKACNLLEIPPEEIHLFFYTRC